MKENDLFMEELLDFMKDLHRLEVACDRYLEQQAQEQIESTKVYKLTEEEGKDENK